MEASDSEAGCEECERKAAMRCTSGCSALSEAARPSAIPTLKLSPPLSLRSGVVEAAACARRAEEAVTDVDAKAEDDENSMLR